MKLFWLILYYGFARHLPGSYSRVGGNLSLKLRRLCCKHLFKRMGKNVNIEHGAWFLVEVWRLEIIQGLESIAIFLITLSSAKM